MSITTGSQLDTNETVSGEAVPHHENVVGKALTVSSSFWLRRPVLTVFLLAFAIRGLVALLLTRFFSGSLVLDDQTYWTIAGDVAAGTTGEWTAYEGGLYAQTRAFSLPLSVVYRLTGGTELAGQLLVALFGAALCVVVYLFARRMVGQRLAYLPALLIALLPSQVLWSSLILKDAFVWFGLALTALVFVKQSRVSTGKRLALWGFALAGSIFFLAFLRPHSTVVVAWSLLLACWAGGPELRRARIAVVAGLAVLVPWIAGLGPAGVSFALSASPVSEIREANAAGAQSAIVAPPPDLLPTTPEVKAHIDEANKLAAQQDSLNEQIAVALEAKEGEDFRELPKRERARAEARLERLQKRLEIVSALLATEQAAIQEATEARTQVPSDPTRDVGVRYVARGVSVMVAEPYPWNRSTSPAFTMAKFEMILWYPTLALAILGLYVAIRRHRDVMILPVIMGGGIMLMYALTEGNVGTAFRHRGEFVWVVALLAGLGLALIIEKRVRPE